MRKKYGEYIEITDCLGSSQKEMIQICGASIGKLLTALEESDQQIDIYTLDIMVRPIIYRGMLSGTTIGIKYEVEEEDVDNNISGCGLKY